VPHLPQKLLPDRTWTSHWGHVTSVNSPTPFRLEPLTIGTRSPGERAQLSIAEVCPMIDWSRYSELVVLTGAGVSVASGLGTYRGKGGLWEKSGVAEEATAECMAQDPWRSWQFFLPLMEQIVAAKPNPAHRALAQLEERFQGDFLLVTQNVDGLHTAAGSNSVAEIHGNITRRRCTSLTCNLEPHYDFTIPTELPLCPTCKQPLRPDIVLFGEQLPIYEAHLVKKALRTVDLFLAVGTSGTVHPAASYVSWAQYAGALTIEVNPETSGVFCRSYQEKAELGLPELVVSLKP
jgi:NAD-dependent deacetylase